MADGDLPLVAAFFPKPGHPLGPLVLKIPEIGADTLLKTAPILLCEMNCEIEPKLHDWFVRFEVRRSEEEKLA